jgi:quinol monooxygenase YgiN
VIFIVVRMTPKPEHVERFPEFVADFTAATRGEPGNLFFEWSRSLDNPSEYVLVEGFRDGDAGSEHVNSAHFQKFVAEAPAVLASTPLIISHTIDADGWGEMGEIKVG